MEGINIIGWQLDQQYENRAGKEKAIEIPHEAAWTALNAASDKNLCINK